VATVICFVANFRHFEKQILKYEYSAANSLFLKKKMVRKRFFNFKIIKNCDNCEQYIVLKIFYFHILNIAEMWLNIFMNDHHLSSIAKLKKKHQVTFPLKKIWQFFQLEKGILAKKWN